MKYTIKALEPFGVLIQALDKDYSVEDISIDLLKKYFDQDKLIILRGFKTFSTSTSFANYCERWGEISVWPFGKVLDLTKHQNPEDHIFDNNYVPLHWDGMYRPEIPEYQIFHCLNAPANDQGGQTVFSNTSIIIDKAPAELIDLWKKVNVRYTRQMEFYNSTTFSPLIIKHPYKDKLVIRYNEPPAKDIPDFINPPGIEFFGIDKNQLETMQLKLQESLHSPEAFYAHTWHNNDIVIADNFTLLHGRQAYAKKSGRHLQRVHVNSSPKFKNPGLETYL